MSLTGTLLAFGLRQAFDVDGERLIQVVEGYFTDHSRALPAALARANDRAWQALAVALAGDGWLHSIRVFFASGDDKGIREEVRRLLESSSPPFEGTPADFRRA
jgi:hypothetical protein